VRKLPDGAQIVLEGDGDRSVLAIRAGRSRFTLQTLPENDFPDLGLKPVDTPYGPYLDSYSVEQHKYGPFEPIRAALARLNRKE